MLGNPKSLHPLLVSRTLSQYSEIKEIKKISRGKVLVEMTRIIADWRKRASEPSFLSIEQIGHCQEYPAAFR